MGGMDLWGDGAGLGGWVCGGTGAMRAGSDGWGGAGSLMGMLLYLLPTGLRPRPRPPSGRRPGSVRPWQHPPAPIPPPQGPSTGEESDEGDTYEVPPCESQARKVAPAKRQEDADSTYLDHAAARRCSESYTQLPAQFLSKVSLGPGTDAGNGEEMPWGQAWRKALDRSRAQLPQAPCSRRGSLPSAGRTPPPQPAGPAAPQNPGLASWNKDRSLGEEVYLACELPSPPPCRAALAPRRLLSQVPPLRPPKIPKPKIILPGPEQKLADASPRAWSKGLACPGGGGAPQEDPDQAWYAGSCDRQTAESVLQGVNKDGAFMVRQSSGQGWSQPFTLAVLHRGHVYNIPIRYLASSCQYTLGKDRKGHEQRFASVAAMVQHYQEHPLVLIDGSSASRAPARLLFPAKP
ncbi:SH2 domain-containing protein 6 isoform X2 [Pelodiscus sinensis]|uniref:SH2 domain-containing protein 6 isoform X2 n=1 Tax=Pelodiscus sinensis TaxID=13735 RepID=UPI003F6C8886